MTGARAAADCSGGDVPPHAAGGADAALQRGPAAPAGGLPAGGHPGGAARHGRLAARQQQPLHAAHAVDSAAGGCFRQASVRHDPSAGRGVLSLGNMSSSTFRIKDSPSGMRFLEYHALQSASPGVLSNFRDLWTPHHVLLDSLQILLTLALFLLTDDRRQLAGHSAAGADGAGAAARGAGGAGSGRAAVGGHVS